MKTFIHEIGVIDKSEKIHPVYFKQGLNVVTGKSSTGKSALIEIFDYCFGSSEYTVPKGVITDNALIYYVCLQVDEQDIVIARRPDMNTKAFFRREDGYDPKKIHPHYFEPAYFRHVDEYKKHLRDLFLDIDDVDVSSVAKSYRKNNAKAATPSVRSFSSFMLQHQNLVANKHALFYRFDEKAKRDQVIEHTKIFLGLVDQQFFHLSQEKERLAAELKGLTREKEAYRKVAENQKKNIGPVLLHLYAMMGFEEEPISLQQVLRDPQDAKYRLDELITPEMINPNSDALTKRYNHLKKELDTKVSQLRKLQRQASSIEKNISEESRFVENSRNFQLRESVQVATTICPFCHTEQDKLKHSAEHLQQAIAKLSSNLSHARPMRAKFASSLLEVNHQIENVSKEVSAVNEQVKSLEVSESELAGKKSHYETVLMTKASLYISLDTISLVDDSALDKRYITLKGNLSEIEGELRKYNFRKGIEKADDKVNEYMAEIGKNFEFEKSYKPISLHFSFETFDLYHQVEGGEKIFLRSMGSGANWLYCHITLFLALHKYFAELGDQCSIPSILFLDQPTQVYFPSFKYDRADKFNKEQIAKLEHRTESERPIDDDMKAVENLFSQLSIYCTDAEQRFGFSPQIIVTDHADDLTLSDGINFEDLVNNNRWRTKGLIDPVP